MTARTRWNELLDLPNAIRFPDLYELIGMHRLTFDPRSLEPAFRERMQKLQGTRSTKHKEFLEFAKAELRRARRVLGEEGERARYDRDEAEQREHELRRVLDPVLTLGPLTQAAAKVVLTAALDMGLSDSEARRIMRATAKDASPQARADLELGANSDEIRDAVQRRLSSRRSPGHTTRRFRRPVFDAQGAPLAPGATPADGAAQDVAKPPSGDGTPAAGPSPSIFFCEPCGVSLPERWRERGSGERLGARLLCNGCVAKVRDGRACVACSLTLDLVAGAGDWPEEERLRICERCEGSVRHLRFCRACRRILGAAALERGEAVETEGECRCRACGGRDEPAAPAAGVAPV